MEIDEVAARLVRRYWALLIACILLPIVVITVMVARQPAMYAANARIITSSAVPVSAAQADAIVSQVQGIATGPTIAAQALRAAGVRRSVPEFVAAHVNVNGLGTSQVVDITVTDPSARIAQKAAKLLAASVVSALNKVGQSGLSAALTAIDSEIARLTEQRAVLAGQVMADPRDQQLQANLAGIDQVIANFTGDRSRLLIQASTQGVAAVIDDPGLPQDAESKALGQKLGLAALLGLVFGILLAAIAEMIRPTVPGARRVSRRLSAPLLGGLAEDELGGRRTPNVEKLALQVRLAAAQAGVPAVAVVDIAGQRRLSALAEQLTDAMPARAGRPQGMPGTAPAFGAVIPDGRDNGSRRGATSGRRTMPGTTLTMEPGGAAAERALRVYALEQLEGQAETGRAGIVVMSGPVNRLSGISAMADLSAAAGWPIIGVVGIPRPRGRWRRARASAQDRPDAVLAGGAAETAAEISAE